MSINYKKVRGGKGEQKEEKVEKILEIDNKKCFLQFSQLIRKKMATN